MADMSSSPTGQEFSGYVVQVEDSLMRIRQVLPELHQLAIGGTAVGTGLNTHPEFAGLVTKELERRTGFPFVPAPNRFSQMAGRCFLQPTTDQCELWGLK